MTVDLADKYGTFEDKYDAIIQISANIDSYFPINEINSQAQNNNIQAIISHATHAYGMLKKENNNREETETKLRQLQEKVEILEKELEKIWSSR